MSGLSSDYVSMLDLVQAYRKAKADCFYEKSLTTSIPFAEYEQDLHYNLKQLRDRLTSKSTRWYSDTEFIGGCVFLPKGLEHVSSEDSRPGQFISTDPMVAWSQATKSHKPVAAFRPVADFTVPMHIISALWVNKIGDRLDSLLDKSAYGARLRRIWSDDGNKRYRAYHIDAVGSFEWYFNAYRNWRKHGITAARQALLSDHSIVILTMDLQSYYHNIDPCFMLNPDFLAALGGDQSDLLAENDHGLTKQLLEAFQVWGRELPGNSIGPVGLPVGASASRILSNVLLAEFDRSVQEHLTPLFYGRYVDDIFLVLKATPSMTSEEEVMKHCASRIPQLETSQSEMLISLPYAGSSNLRFQKRKQRYFHLTPDAGLDLLDTIESRIREVSSEWRMLPDPDDLEQSPAARVLVATRDPGEEADSLTRADHLSIRRLGFSILMSGCDTLSQDLPRDEWKQQRRQLYRFIESYVLTPLRLFDLHDYVARVMSIAVATRDWSYAKRFVRLLHEVLHMLEEGAAGEEYEWAGLRRFFANVLFESACGAFSAADTGPRVPKSLRDTLTEVRALGAVNTTEAVEAEEVLALARLLDYGDLGRIPLKDQLDSLSLFGDDTGLGLEINTYESWRLDGVREFLQLAGQNPAWAERLLFPTRPHTPAEIAELVPQCVVHRELWRMLTRSLRGVWVREADDDDGNEIEGREIKFTTRQRRSKPRLAVTSYHVSDEAWHRAAEGNPDVSQARYSRLAQLANAILNAEHKPDYVIFPELSIPRRFIRTLAHHFLREGISLIAGVEYDVSGPYVRNEAKLYLTDHSLGFPSYISLTQPKLVPAHVERDLLRSHHGLSFVPPPAYHVARPIYRHGPLTFGLLLCSELTKAEYRADFRGQIDALFVLSWNQDIESFGSLIESASLDIHGFQVLVNNRKYGDSRVRVPYRERWLRDCVRVRGGLDDYFVICELDVPALREYQSHVEPDLNGLFKPTPEGFVISPERRRTPGGMV